LVVNGRANITTAAVPVTAPSAALDREDLFWTSIKDGSDPAAFDAYLKQYPDGTFAPLARQRLASAASPARTLDAARFDGSWNVTIECPPHQGAAGYSMQFLAEVKDGVLAGQFGSLGQPNSLTLSGKIQPDGKASVDARGMTGDPKFTLNRASPGLPY